MVENRISLTEVAFTNICKNGFTYQQTPEGRLQINLTKNDIKVLMVGKILTKKAGNINVLFALQDIGRFTIGEIVKRSPIYSDIIIN
jgi:hypothetical protein